jgi:uncharacterized membrane protein YoaK (UPF0700 family)
MPLIQRDHIVGKYFWLWPLFALQAGLVNSGGFLACHRFVTHVTGFGTRVGMEFLEKNILLGIEMLSIPLGFIGGCIVAGFFHESAVRKERPILATVPLMLMSLLLTLVSVLGSLGMFGVFGEPLIFQRDIALLLILCFAAGLQNGFLTSLTHGVVRTTHMTGVATDLGLSFVKRFFFNEEKESKWFKLRFKKILAFSVGAAIGTFLFDDLHYFGFLIPAVMNCYLLFQLFRAMKVNLSSPAVAVRN